MLYNPHQLLLVPSVVIPTHLYLHHAEVTLPILYVFLAKIPLSPNSWVVTSEGCLGDFSALSDPGQDSIEIVLDSASHFLCRSICFRYFLARDSCCGGPFDLFHDHHGRPGHVPGRGPDSIDRDFVVQGF